ncbi:uncharacterized protein [Amphiura filiformis]|uniref:uncharacterized protein isoform X2 n=1 Tax=Amphiura filiformis TaxID=82378 RepID=UPI003B21E23E
MFTVKLRCVFFLVATGLQAGLCQNIPYVHCAGDNPTLSCRLPDGQIADNFDEIEIYKQVGNGGVTTAELMATKMTGDMSPTIESPFDDTDKFNIAIDLNRKSATIQIISVDNSDDALYWCVFHGGAVQDTSVNDELVLIVLQEVGNSITLENEGTSDTTTTDAGESTNLLSDNNAQFRCVVMDGEKEATIEWFRNGMLITDGADFDISTSYVGDNTVPSIDTTSSLTFSPANANQNDVITCRASVCDEALGLSNDRSFTLNIFNPGSATLTNTETSPVDSIVISTLNGAEQKTTNVIFDSSTTFSCVVENDNPDAVIQWYINDVQQVATGTTTGGTTLDITPTMSNQGDVIRCQTIQRDGSNTLIGERNLSFTLDVFDSGTISVTKTQPAPDQTTRGTGTTTSVSPGESATFICEITNANPEVAITWYCNGVQVDSTAAGIDITSTSSPSTLEFTPDTNDHDKTVVCRSTQTRPGFDPDTQEAGFVLNVLDLPDTMRIFVKKPSETAYKEYEDNDNVVINPGLTDVRCETTNSNPVVTMSWTIGGASASEHSSSGGTPNTVNGNTFFDYDSYILDRDIQTCVQVVCAASNAAIVQLGQQATYTRTVNIQVRQPPEIPTITLNTGSGGTIVGSASDDPIMLIENNEYVFNCEASDADPEADIQWTLYDNNGQVIVGGGEIDQGNEDDADCNLENNVKSYTLEASFVQHESLHGGYLECKALNEYYNDENSGSTTTRRNFRVGRGPNPDLGEEVVLRYRQGMTDPYTDIAHDDIVYVNRGTQYEFQCEVFNVLPTTESIPSVDATDLFFYYDNNFSPGVQMNNEPAVPSQSVPTLYDLTDEYRIVPTITDTCPTEIRCIVIYDVTNSSPDMPTLSDTPYVSAQLIQNDTPPTSVVITPPVFSDPLMRGSLSNDGGVKVLQLYEGDVYTLQCGVQGADPSVDITWTIDDCSGGSSILLRRRAFSETNADCTLQDDTDTWDNYVPNHFSQDEQCLRCTAGDVSEACRLDIIPISTLCEPDRVIIWEYAKDGVTVPVYYDQDSDRIIKANANEVRTLNCTSYEAAPITYNAWTTPDGRPLPDTFISSDCAYVYDESKRTTQFNVTKYDTTKCVHLLLDYSWHLSMIQCSATNIANLEGVDSLPVTIYICVPCHVNLAIVAPNYLGYRYDVNNGSVISLDASGDTKTLSCINRGARGQEYDDTPNLEFFIKEDGSDSFVKLTSDDGVEFIESKILYVEDDAEFGQAKYQGLWEVRVDVTLSAQGSYDLDGATLACVCRNRVYQGDSEARYEVKLSVSDTPLRDENLVMVQGYPDMIRNVANTDIILVNYGPFLRQKRQTNARETLEVTCIARGTRPAVDIIWRIAGELISEDYINVVIEDSILNVGAFQLQDTISTFTVFPVPRSYHYQNVTCEVASRSDLLVRSARLIVLTPPDTPLQLTGNNVIEEEGQLVTLECRAEHGYPEGVFQWRSGSVILREEQIQSESSLLPNYRYDQISTYSFSANRELNGRNITCAYLQHYEEYDFISETTATIRISLAYCPASSAQVSGCPTSPIQSGQTVSFTCESGIANPESDLAWFINGVEQTPTNYEQQTTREVNYGYITTRPLTLDLKDSDDGLQVHCCHKTAIGGTPCDTRCSDVCTIDVLIEQPPPSGLICRWVRVRVTLENINGNSALWTAAYEDSSSSEYQQLTSYLLDIFQTVYSPLTDYRSSVVPTIYRSPEGLIGVIIGLEFDSPIGTDVDTIHSTLIDTLDANGVIQIAANTGYAFDIIPSSVGEECVCPTNYCVRGPSCTPSETDYTSSCQCPADYAPPRCKDPRPSPEVTTRFPPSRGITHGCVVFVLEEIDDLPAVWNPAYDDPSSEAAQELTNGLETVLTDVFERSFSCLRRVIVADLYHQYSRGIGVIVRLEFIPDCGNSVVAIRNVYIQSIDFDGKIDGSIYEFDTDLSNVGVTEVCGPFFLCANGGVCEPSLYECSSSCRCPSPYTGTYCEDTVRTPSPPRPTRKIPESKPTGLTTTELILIIVFSILGVALLLGLLICCCCFYCCPLGAVTRRRYIYTEEENVNALSVRLRRTTGHGKVEGALQ